MPSDLTNKLVLITGASSGIGAACAVAFAARGCRLILTARRMDRLEKLRGELREKHSVEVIFLKQDISDVEAVKDVLSYLPEHARDVDILVNNAGLALGAAAAHEVNMADVQTMINTNLTGMIAITRAILPGMVARNCGHVLNISSIAGHEAYAGGAIYCATKHAVQAFTDCLRHDVVDTQVRVTAISPGAVNTEFSLVRYQGDTQKAAAVYDGIQPLIAEDIAEDVLYAATRPGHVQCAEIVTFATLQSSAKGLARVLK